MMDREKSIEESAKELVHQGVDFFANLSDTLSSSEKTEALLNSIVKVDKVTGESKLEIPIPDKTTVERILRLFNKLGNASSI